MALAEWVRMVAPWHERLSSALWMMVSSARRAQGNVIMKEQRKNDGVVTAPVQRRNEAFRTLSDKLRKLSEGRPQTPSEVLLRQSREER